MLLKGITDEMVRRIAQMEEPMSWADYGAQEDANDQKSVVLNSIKRLFEDMSTVSQDRLTTLSEEAQQLFQSSLAAMQQILDSEEDPNLMKGPRDEEAYTEGMDPAYINRPTMPPEGIPYSS